MLNIASLHAAVLAYFTSRKVSTMAIPVQPTATITEAQLETAMKNAGVQVLKPSTQTQPEAAKPAAPPTGQILPAGTTARRVPKVVPDAAPLSDTDRITTLEQTVAQLRAKLRTRLANF